MRTRTERTREDQRVKAREGFSIHYLFPLVISSLSFLFLSCIHFSLSYYPKMMHEDKEKGMGKRYRMEIEAKARLEHLEKPWHVDKGMKERHLSPLYHSPHPSLFLCLGEDNNGERWRLGKRRLFVSLPPLTIPLSLSPCRVYSLHLTACPVSVLVLYHSFHSFSSLHHLSHTILFLILFTSWD